MEINSVTVHRTLLKIDSLDPQGSTSSEQSKVSPTLANEL